MLVPEMDENVPRETNITRQESDLLYLNEKFIK